jgi:hypothetical protein
MMTTIDNEQARAEAKAACEQTKVARWQARAEARAARVQAKAARSRAIAEAKAAREQARLQDRFVILDPILAPYTLQRVQEQIREHIRSERIQRVFRERKQKVIKTEDLEKEIEDVCILCLDKHQIKDSIETSCNHLFGFECFQAFINTNENYNKHCPMCRNTEYSITSFKARKPPTRKNNTRNHSLTHSLTQ